MRGNMDGIVYFVVKISWKMSVYLATSLLVHSNRWKRCTGKSGC